MKLLDQTKSLLVEIEKSINTNEGRITNNCFFLSDGILSLENEKGSARHPYQNDGMLLWANQNGKISLNDGSFYLIPESLEGESNALAFFLGIKEGNNYKPYSLFEFNKNIFEGDVERYTVFFTSYVIYILRVNNVVYSIRFTVNKEKAMLMDTIIYNSSNETKSVYSSLFLNFKFMHGNYDSVETKWFKQAKYTNNYWELYTVEDFSRFEHVSNFGGLARVTSKEVESENTTSRGVYSSSRTGRIENSKCLLSGKFSHEKNITLFSEMSSVGDILKFELLPKESIEVAYKLERFYSKKEIAPLLIEEVSNAFDLLKEEKDIAENSKDYLNFSFKGGELINPDTFAKFLKEVLIQVDYCATAKNSSLTLLGVRDVFQAIEAAIYFEPKAMRNRIVDIMNYLDITGRFPRQFAFKEKGHDTIGLDNREFIDQAYWVFDAVYNYLAFTDDYSILSEKAGYIEVVNPRQAKISKQEDTVLDHLLRTLNFLLDNIDPNTGCQKTLYGDWNDAIDGLGMSDNPNEQFGNGVSVMATFQLYSTLNKFNEILAKSNKHLDVYENNKLQLINLTNAINKYAFVSKNGKSKILHGWGNNASFYVGSFKDIDGQERDTLTSNAFYVISKFYKENDKYISSVYESYRRLDSKYGFKTFEPFFDVDSRRVGRIVNLPKGTAENAATYIHSATFAIDSLFTLGQDKWAWEQINKILPFTHKYVTSTPFVMPNSYVYNPEIDCDGESMNDWYTGSSNTLIKALVRSGFGFRVDLDKIVVETSNYFPFDEALMSIKICNSNVTLVHKNGNGKRVIKLNGHELNLTNNGIREVAIINKDELSSIAVIEVIN